VAKSDDKYFFLDPNRCIGCKACVEACSECDTHKGHSMIHLEFVDRSATVQTAPMVCMHCDTPTCAEVCPADAIKRSADGVVLSAQKPRCIACNNCVLACPFGVPKMLSEFELMMKCDMCYDRTSIGKQPMCTTVCPSRALHYGTLQEIEELRPRSKPFNQFQFGQQEIRTKVQMMIPRETQPEYLDVAEAIIGGALETKGEPHVFPLEDLMLDNVYVTSEAR
jgi:Fe-S-cluster-containing dehydrogenase component